MIQVGKLVEDIRDSCSPKSAITCNSNLMALNGPSTESPLKAESSPFGGAFPDPLCKLNLKETSEFVRSFPMSNRNGAEDRGLLTLSAQRKRESSVQKRMEAPSTPGRPVFSFSIGNPSRKGVPSKWDDAEKWLISSSCHESPAHYMVPSGPPKISRQNGGGFHQRGDAFEDIQSINEDNISALPVTSYHGAALGVSLSPQVLLKDKFTDNVEPIFSKFRYSEPAQEGFLFRNTFCEPMKDATTDAVTEVHHRDVGTEMTPIGSSTTSRCHTPLKCSSPARHNTPASRSGPLVASSTSIDISELKDCHFAKLDLGAQFDSVVSNWSSREEEEEEISKSLRHFEVGGGRKSNAESRASAWEDEEKAKSCIRYQREEAKIQAWVNLERAKAEAQSRKLEVKIQKMRSDLEEKLMKRMASVHRRGEEWRATAQMQHSQQVHRASEQAQKMKSQQRSHHSSHTSCGCLCFPCNSLI